MQQGGNAAIAARQVSFSLFQGHTKLVEGNFTIMQMPGVTCFGASKELAVQGKRERASLFEGVVIEHQLNVDGSASINLKYFSVEPAENSPIGYRQAVAVKAGLSMGSESGNEKLESIMLGASHELVFRSHAFA